MQHKIKKLLKSAMILLFQIIIILFFDKIDFLLMDFDVWVFKNNNLLNNVFFYNLLLTLFGDHKMIIKYWIILKHEKSSTN